MKSAFAFTLAAAAAVSFVTATISVTYPVASTTCTGGQDFGSTTAGIYVGSKNTQVLLLDLGDVADPTTTLELDAVTIPASIGENGDYYFVRFQSASATDPDTGYPLQAFSAKFTLTGMTGTFSKDQQAAIDGAAAASSSSSSSSSSSRSTSRATSSSTSTKGSSASATAAVANNAKSSTSNTTSSASKDADSGASAGLSAGVWNGALVGAVMVVGWMAL